MVHPYEKEGREGGEGDAVGGHRNRRARWTSFSSLSPKRPASLSLQTFSFIPSRYPSISLAPDGLPSRFYFRVERQGGRRCAPSRWRVLLPPSLLSTPSPLFISTPKLTSLPSILPDSTELSLSHAALVQSRLRTQLRETRDEIAYLRQELEKDQSSNRIQIIQELIVVSILALSSTCLT